MHNLQKACAVDFTKELESSLHRLSSTYKTDSTGFQDKNQEESESNFYLATQKTQTNGFQGENQEGGFL